MLDQLPQEWSAAREEAERLAKPHNATVFVPIDPTTDASANRGTRRAFLVFLDVESATVASEAILADGSASCSVHWEAEAPRHVPAPTYSSDQSLAGVATSPNSSQTPCRVAHVMITSGAASGKSTLTSQLVMCVIKRAKANPAQALVPIHVQVMSFAQMLIQPEHEAKFRAAPDWIDGYLQIVHGPTSEVYIMLRQAMAARRALIIIDGLDEGGDRRESISRHIRTQIAPQARIGCTCACTCTCAHVRAMWSVDHTHVHLPG
jgi:hypothetical protein